MIGKEAINIAAAGVGNPIKEEVCLVSRLNFANRIAEKIVMINPMKLLEGKNMTLEEVQDGVKDAEIIQQLFKNMT